ncbi:hypothetical protein GOBAR_AA26337 [Gossypium barbadense]|uniref:Reverse transcriptase zinc-binding domain-containing protein n=1 Tax=Gossypium barbadense TaxID=3634 RepID=A0A2P5WTB6_GOSBA|nr:hypothetical protein GOBAR_AA26337 [Gossypium barbadense]
METGFRVVKLQMDVLEEGFQGWILENGPRHSADQKGGNSNCTNNYALLRRGVKKRSEKQISREVTMFFKQLLAIADGHIQRVAAGRGMFLQTEINNRLDTNGQLNTKLFRMMVKSKHFRDPITFFSDLEHKNFFLCSSVGFRVVLAPMLLGLRKNAAKSVPLNVHNLWCRHFIIPKVVLRKMDRMCSNFFWKGQEGSDQGAQVKWTDICKPKSESGWGLRFGDLEQGMHSPTLMVYPNPSSVARKKYRLFKQVESTAEVIIGGIKESGKLRLTRAGRVAASRINLQLCEAWGLSDV